MTLDDRQVDLFSRQVLLREVGGKGQERLLASRVLVFGSGLAAEAAATYLAGAGVGMLGVGGGDRSSRSAFAQPGERCPDAQVVEVEALPPVDLATWDVLVEVTVDGMAALESAAHEGGWRGRPRLGSVAISFGAAEGTGLLVVPSGTGGCAACHEIGAGDGASAVARSTGARPRDAAAVDLLLAGDLAALAALGLVLDFEFAKRPSAWRLACDAPAFVAVPVGRRASCPRGCSA